MRRRCKRAIDDVNRLEKLPIAYEELIPRRELAAVGPRRGAAGGVVVAGGAGLGDPAMDLSRRAGPAANAAACCAEAVR
jgi:hypothetical protein